MKNNKKNNKTEGSHHYVLPHWIKIKGNGCSHANCEYGRPYCGCAINTRPADLEYYDPNVSEEDCPENLRLCRRPFNPKAACNRGGCGSSSKSHRLQHEDYMDNLYRRVFADETARTIRTPCSQSKGVLPTDASSHSGPVGTLNHCCVCDSKSKQYACQTLAPIVNRGDTARRKKECRETGAKYGLPSHHVIGSDCGEDGHGNCKHNCWPAPPVSL